MPVGRDTASRSDWRGENSVAPFSAVPGGRWRRPRCGGGLASAPAAAGVASIIPEIVEIPKNLEMDLNGFCCDCDGGRGLDKVAEDVSRLGGFVAMADTFAEQTVEAAGHQGQLEVQVHLHGNGR